MNYPSPDKGAMGERKLTLTENHLAGALYGPRNSNLRLVSQMLEVEVNARGNQLRIVGPEDKVLITESLLGQLYDIIAKGQSVSANDVEFATRILLQDPSTNLSKIFLDRVIISSQKRTVAPKSLAQKAYIEAIRTHDLVFGVGPAGTGKTYLAMAMAVAALTAEKVRRIVLCRPAVEAGEKLGFLPGDLAEKVNPYLRPLYDALHDMLDFTKADRLMSQGIIEVAPLAFMRGRTLNDSFVILDEAQNTTREQMKMFLTRLGFSSKAVVTGDVTQIDLPTGATSGLVECQNILQGIEGISIVKFTQLDVIRHPLVQKIISAYEVLDERLKNERLNAKKAESEGSGGRG